MNRTLWVVSGTSRKARVTSERRGAMLVFVAISMVTLCGFLALTVDVGAGGRQRRIAQTAADAAAIGGAAEIWRKHYGLVTSAAVAEAVRNGFDAADVTVNYPPATGPYAGQNAYVEVIINKTMPSIFGSLLDVTSMNVRARGVAGVGSASSNCIFSLDPDGAQAVEVRNGGELTTNCGISVNSTNNNALDVNQSGLINTNGAGITVAGDWTGNKDPIPAPATGSAPVVNPLAYVTMPDTIPPCDHTGLLTTNQDTTINPGVYCGGLDIDTKTTTLNPGTYIFVGGGLRVRTSGIIIGAGVTLINTIDPTGVYSFGPFDFGNGCKAKLSAPTSGEYSGILMFADPAGPAGVENIFACSSDDPPELTGALYFPTQQITFNGSNTNTQIAGAVIAKTVEVSSKLSIVFPPGGGWILQRFALVE